MSRRPFLGALLLVLAGAAPASGQILDSDPDVVGLYVDPVGNVPGICQIFTPTTVYLMITHPSDPSGLTGFGCTLSLPPDLVVVSTWFPGAVTTSIFPVIDLGFATPRPVVGEAYLVGTLQALVMSATPSEVRLVPHFPPVGPLAAYTTVDSGATLIGLHAPDWGNGMPGLDPRVILWLNQVEWCRYATPVGTGA